MDSKKKKKVIVISVIVALILIAIIIVGVILGVQKRDENNQGSQNGSNMSTTTVTNTYNEAIAKKEITQSYNGVYAYKSINRVEFAKDLTQKDIEKICINKTSKPYVNDLLSYLDNERKNIKDKFNEKLVLFSGQFNKNINDNPFDKNSDKGLYYGNDNLAMVTTDKTIFFISLNYSDINNTIPIKDSLNQEQRKIYVMEKVYSNSIDNPNRLLFTVTYVYELIDEEIKTIPDSELDFDIKV